MIRTLAWKEYREQRSFWIALVSIGVLFVLGTRWGLTGNEWGHSPASQTELFQNLLACALGFSFIYGLVSGSMLFAGDREAEAQWLLDTLPVSRAELWRTKVAFGSLSVLSHTLFAGILVSATLFLCFPHAQHGLKWAGLEILLFLVLAWDGFAWGSMGSATASTVLRAAGLGIGFNLAAWTVAWAFGLPLGLLTPISPNMPNPIYCFAIRALMPILALYYSRRWYCRDELTRMPVAAVAAGTRVRAWRTMFWLTWRQGRWLILGMLLAGTVTGYLIALDPVPVWLVLTFIIGIVCGTQVFSNEQDSGTQRFWGDLRLSPTRVWLLKLGFWLLVLIVVAGFNALDAAVNIAFRRQHGPQSFEATISSSGGGILLHLMGWMQVALMPLIYGFATAQLTVLACRKSVIALVVSSFAAAVLMAPWLPLMAAGGVTWWQLFAVPIILIIASRLALWHWVSGRLQTPRPILSLVACGLLIVSWIIGNIYYRGIEVPDVGEPFDVGSYVASLPSEKENADGRLTNLTLQEFAARLRQLDAELGKPKSDDFPYTSAAFDPTLREYAAGSFIHFAAHSLRFGWPEQGKELTAWLDRMCEVGWIDTLLTLSDKPLGMLHDPRVTSVYQFQQEQSLYRAVGVVLATRALQLQSDKSDDKALDQLLLGLRLSRHLRHHAGSYKSILARSVEDAAMHGFHHWLKKVGPKKELLQKALAGVTEHEKAIPPDVENVKADYLGVRRLLEDPAMSWFTAPRGRQVLHAGDFTHELLSLTRMLPFEQERLRRIVDLYFSGAIRAAEAPTWEYTRDFQRMRMNLQAYPLGPDWMPPQERKERLEDQEWVGRLARRSWLFPMLQIHPVVNRFFKIEGLTDVRALRLQLALALYQIDHKKPADTLDELEPTYLPKVPLDPYSGLPFRYRISKGEGLMRAGPDGSSPAGNMESFQISAGQGVLEASGLQPSRTPDTVRPRWETSGLSPDSNWYQRGFVYLVPVWSK